MSPQSSTVTPDDDIRTALQVLHEPGQVFEIRALGSRGSIATGYYDDVDSAVEGGARLDASDDVHGVYVTLNQLKPACLARAANRYKAGATASSDNDIQWRRWLLVDLDPARPADTSSTNDELAAAKARARLIRDDLLAQGWPEPVVARSGNGMHLLYRIDLPNDATAKSLVEQVLRALELRYGDVVVAIDTSVSNAARIVRLYGTAACKGDSVPDRPHRLSAIVSVPEERIAVARERLEELAATIPVENMTSAARGEVGAFDLDSFMARNGIDLLRLGSWNGGRKWVLACCPFDSTHTGGCAVLLQFSNGAVAYKCHHNSCSNRKWKDVREHFEPGGPVAQSSAPETALGHQIVWDDLNPWPTLSKDALFGLGAEIVSMIEPHTEADPVALYLTALTMFGNAAGNADGSSPFVRVGAVKHPPRLFTLLSGATAKSRKGQSYAEVRRVFAQADAAYLDSAEISGLSTGEGLIFHLRDPEPPKGDKEQEEEPVDKRAFVHESEFARVLTAAGRTDCTLSQILRDAWDVRTLRVLTRKQPLVARNAYISILAHITQDELVRKITDTDIANGLLNRFVVVAVRRSKQLPSGGRLRDETIEGIGKRLHTLIQRARGVSEAVMSPAAEKVWDPIYRGFQDEHGLVGAAVARDDAQTLRLALILALMDENALFLGEICMIQPAHVNAAYAMWQYVDASTKHVFGARLGDDIADRLLEGVRAVWPNGLTMTEQSKLFSGHALERKLPAARALLIKLGLIRIETRETGGRPVSVAYAIRPREKGEISEASATGGDVLLSHDSLSSQGPETLDPEVELIIDP